MKRALYTILLSLLSISAVWAQPGRSMERIHAAKMVYITDRLHLTTQQSSNFVPLYNNYEGELRSIRQSFRQKYKSINPDESDNETARKYIDDNLDYQQQVLDLKRRYNNRFLKVLSSQQLADLYQAEREFRQLLMQELKQQRNNGGSRMFKRGNGY